MSVDNNGNNDVRDGKEDVQKRVEEEDYGPWIFVDRRGGRRGFSKKETKNVNHGLNHGQSRFAILDEFIGNVDGAINRENNQDQSLSDVVVENGIQASFIKKSASPKDKGKGIAIGNRPKVASQVLKPFNKNIGSVSDLDKSILVPKGNVESSKTDKGDKIMVFQSVILTSKLDKLKHQAHRSILKEKDNTDMENERISLISGKENGMFRFGDFSNEAVPKRLCDLMPN